MTYDLTLHTQLKQADIPLSFGELHGFLSGLICGGIADKSWQPLLFQFTNDNHAYPVTLMTSVETLYAALGDRLDSMTDFELPLRGQNVFETADSLYDWVNQFLLGLGLAQPYLDNETDEDIVEALADLQEIARLTYDENDNQDTLSDAVEEIGEYVRTIALLFHTHYRRQPTAAKPVLH